MSQRRAHIERLRRIDCLFPVHGCPWPSPTILLSAGGRCQQRYLFSRRIAPEVCKFFHPDEGWAERRQAPGCGGIRWARRVTQDARERAYVTRRAGALARRPCVPQVRRNARLSALHHGGFGSGSRASISGISSRAVQRSSSQPGRSAWRAGFPNLPRILVTSQHPRDAIPCSAFRIVSRKRPS
jgi:hypothetical protein